LTLTLVKQFISLDFNFDISIDSFSEIAVVSVY